MSSEEQAAAQYADAKRMIEGAWVKWLGSDAPDKSIYNFALHFRGLLQDNVGYLAFLEDMMTNRLKINIQPLKPENPLAQWAKAETLEEVAAMYDVICTGARRRCLIWPLPDTGIYADIRGLSQEQQAVADPSQEKKLSRLLARVERNIDALDSLAFEKTEKLISVPIRHKGQLTEKFSRNSSSLPHTDNAIVLLLLWLGRGTLLYQKDDFQKHDLIKHPLCVRPDGVITAYEIPEYSMLLMPPRTLHSGNPETGDSYFERVMSRAFMEQVLFIQDFDELNTVVMDRLAEPVHQHWGMPGL